MRYLKNLTYLALIVNLFLFASCAKKPASPPEVTGLEKEFLENFKKTSQLDFALNTTARIFGKTFWIYVATDKELVQISAMSSRDGFTPEKIVKFLDVKCQFEDSVFNSNYIFLKYSPEERAKQQDLFQKTIGGSSLFQDFTKYTLEILQKVYFSIGDILAETESLNFFAICLADIKNGIKITFVIHRLDMEQFLNNMLPPDEFYGRMILKTDGSKEIINDKYGISLQYNDISIADFLEEQIVNNIKSKINDMEKFVPEQLKTVDKLDDIMLQTIYEVTTKYEFSDYLLVEVENIITKDKLSLSKSKLLSKFANPKSSYLEELEGYNL